MAQKLDMDQSVSDMDQSVSDMDQSASISASISASSASASDMDQSDSTSASSSGMSEGEPGTIIFTDDLINGYRTDPRILLALNGYILLNKKEFLDWFNIDLRQVPYTSNQSNIGRLGARAQETDATYEAYTKILQDMASGVCGGIVESYGQTQMDNIIIGDDNFDILVAVKSDYKTITPLHEPRTVTTKKMEKIVGFIITEIGECKKLPNTVSVKLICMKSRTIKASLLMGAYFCAIKNSKYDQRGILELARGYLNVSGFLSYTNMGFNKDTALFGEDCFDDFRTLQMSADLSEIDTDTIIGLASGGKHPRAGQNDDSGIYDLYKRRIIPVPEELLACNNLLLKTELNQRKLIEAIKQSNAPRYNTRSAAADAVEPEDLVLKPAEITLLGRLGIDEHNIGELVSRLRTFKDELVVQALGAPRKGGLRYYKKNTRKKNTRKKNRRRFTKKAKK